MRTSAFLYPWDVLGDPDAPARIADLGVDAVTLASAYHSTRALTPRHPRTRIVTAPYAAVYYPPSEANWAGRTLRPHRQRWLDSEDAWGEAAERLAGAGLEVATWVVLAHNSRLGGENPQSTVRNAYGDRYPWALCVARPEVVEYCATLAGEAGARPGAVGTELESCGWYGLAHLHAHDKIGGVPLDGAAHYLMSLCFCEVCEAGYAEAGVPELAAAVRGALAPVWAGRVEEFADEWSGVEKLLGSDLAAVTLRLRKERARAVQRACVGAVRGAAGEGFSVLLHADTAAHRVGANVGVEAEWLLGEGGADGLVMPCTGTPAVFPRIPGRTFAANFTVVRGMGGDPAVSVPAGATELRLYHAGLASDEDLAVVRRSLRR